VRSKRQCQCSDIDLGVLHHDSRLPFVRNRATPTSRNDRPSALRKATSSAELRRKRPRMARGPPSTSRTMAARRAAQVLDAGKIPPRRCKGGRLGGRASASRPGAERSRSDVVEEGTFTGTHNGVARRPLMLTISMALQRCLRTTSCSKRPADCAARERSRAQHFLQVGFLRSRMPKWTCMTFTLQTTSDVS
jgi:hypothetical protein